MLSFVLPYTTVGTMKNRSIATNDPNVVLVPIGHRVQRMSCCCCSAIKSSLTVKENVRMKEHVTLTQKEQTRLQVLNSLMADHMTTEQAATLMGVSARHTRRILAAYRRDGAAALAHGNRGRRPANATPDPLATDVVVLARTRYAGVNHTHLSELLREREGIDIGRNTLRKILTDAGVSSPRRRRPPKHRVRRQADGSRGNADTDRRQLPQMAGEDGPQFTLLLAVDDATGIVVNALFCEFGEHPQLLTADADSDTELRHTSRTLFRPPWRLQAHAAVRDRLRPHPVLSRDG